MEQTIAILSDSLKDLETSSTDYMIIEEQLKNNNPQFDEKEEALYVEIPVKEGTRVYSIIFDIIEKYGITYYQIWKDRNSEGQYMKGLSVEAIRENNQVSIKTMDPMLGSMNDWLELI